MISNNLYIQVSIEVSEDDENGCLIKYETARPLHLIKI
jgi:hypothetical protein